MNRSGYVEDDGDDVLAHGRWRGAVASAIRGKKGQAFLKELLAALDAMPKKELIAHELKADGEFCTLGVLGEQRGLPLESLDPEDYDSVACAFNVNAKIVQEIVYYNDTHINDWTWEEVEICGPVRPWYPEWGRHTISYQKPDPTAPARRWRYMRDWVAKQITDGVSVAHDQPSAPSPTDGSTPDNLPPLPEPVDYGYREEGTWVQQLCFTQDQMQAYARAAILAERERFRAMFDEALADHGITWPGEVDILYEKMFPAAAIREGGK